MGRVLLNGLKFTLSVMVGAFLTLTLLNFRFILFDDGAFRVERKREWSLQGTFYWNAPSMGDSGLEESGGRRSGRSSGTTRMLSTLERPTDATPESVIAAQQHARPPARVTAVKPRGRGTGGVGVGVARPARPPTASRGESSVTGAPPEAPAKGAAGNEECRAIRTRIANAVVGYNRQHPDGAMTGLDLFTLIEIGSLDELPTCPTGGEFSLGPNSSVKCSSHK